MTAASLTSPSPYGTALIARASDAVPARYMTGALAEAVTGRSVAPLVLDFIDTRAAFDALEADWTALFARSARSEQLFQSFGWLWHWCNNFLTRADRGLTLAIVTGRRQGRLVLACPFVVCRKKGVATLAFMGDPVSQYGDVLTEDGAQALSDLCAAFDYALDRTRADAVHLRKVRCDTLLAQVLRTRHALTTEAQQAPHASFKGVRDFATFEQRYPKSARKNRKRQMRRLQETGETSFVRLPVGREATEAASLAINLKRQWLRQRGLVSPAIADARTETFFRDCVSGEGPATGVEIGFVRSQGDVAAIEIAIRCKDRVALHLIAYDPRFEKTGAGSLLMEDSIRRSCEAGMETFDLLAPGAAYKFEWVGQVAEVADYSLGLSLKGKFYTSAYLARLRPVAKSLHEHLPMALRRHLATVMGAILLVSDRSGVT